MPTRKKTPTTNTRRKIGAQHFTEFGRRFFSSAPEAYRPCPLAEPDSRHVWAAALAARYKLKTLLGKNACSYADLDTLAGRETGGDWSKERLAIARESKTGSWSLSDALGILSAIRAYAERYADADDLSEPPTHPPQGDAIWSVISDVDEAIFKLTLGQTLSPSYEENMPQKYPVPMLYYPEFASAIAATFARYLVARDLVAGPRKTRFARAHAALTELLTSKCIGDYGFADQCRAMFWAGMPHWDSGLITEIQQRLELLRGSLG